MKLAIVAPCLYPDRTRIHYLEESCAKQGIELHALGVGRPFHSWTRALMEVSLPAIAEIDCTHVLYVDGMDSIIVAPESEILGKYANGTCARCLMSSEKAMYPPCREADVFGGGPFPNGGGWIGEKDFLLDMWTRLHATDPDEGNYQKWLIDNWPIEGVTLDSHCEIFQTMDAEYLQIIPMGSRNRVGNPETETMPCVLHFAGGYVDPNTGRDERMKPWVDALCR